MIAVMVTGVLTGTGFGLTSKAVTIGGAVSVGATSLTKMVIVASAESTSPSFTLNVNVSGPL